MQYLHDLPHIKKSLNHLLKNDPVFSALSIDLSTFDWRAMDRGFPGLVRIVLGQQVSTHAAAALWQRFNDGVPQVTPKAILKLDDDAMRGLGLSRQKIAYIRGLATAVQDGTINPQGLDALSDEEVYAQITELKGFGNWSAEMFLMFGLARPDIWPAGDLGIQEGLRKYKKADTRPDAEATKAAHKIFTPHGTAAALLLWHIKARKDIP